MTVDANPTEAQIEEMRAGARNAIFNCMGVTAQDRVFVMTDRVTHAIGQVLYDAARDAGAAASVRDLEEFTTRPVLEVPPDFEAAVLDFKPTVTFYAASSQPGEVRFRMGMRRVLVEKLNVRHGHMPGITRRLMVEGMRTDYHTIAAVTQRVYELARTAHEIRVTTPDGTDLAAQFAPEMHWIPSTGVFHHPGEWGNLPDGETFTCPQNINGTAVIHTIGDYFSEKYGVLANPITIQIENGRATTLTSPDQAIADELSAYLDAAENGRRVGEFAIGTNIGLTGLVGNLLQDEKLPGLHIAFGNPYPEETGADWSSNNHVDVIATHCTILLDGRTLMRNGQFDYHLLDMPGINA